MERRKIDRNMRVCGIPSRNSLAPSLPVSYVLHDRDAKFCAAFEDVTVSEGIHVLRLPLRSPYLNKFTERWVRSVKEECLSKLIQFGKYCLQLALTSRP